MPTLNPFWHGTPVPPEQFKGRDQERRQVISRIRTGQSTAITSSPRGGKTSLLNYLTAPAHVKPPELRYENADSLFFSYLDAYNWGTEFGAVRFWETAFRPLLESTETTLVQSYQDCKENQFDDYALEKLVMHLREANKRLVLMVDGFDAVLNDPLPHWDTAFFGYLRTLVSRSGGGLVLIFTLNGPLSHFQRAVQGLTRTKSPYFNFVSEVRLGALSEAAIHELLEQAGEHFTETDKQLIRDLAGGHPYLLQVAASMLWEMGGQRQPSVSVIEQFYSQVKEMLEEVWQSWSGALQEAFISVAVIQMKELKEVFQKRLKIDMDKLSRRIPPLKLDLEYLKQFGFLTENENLPGGWQVVPRIFLPFAILNFKAEYRSQLPKEVFSYLFVPGYGEKSKFPFFRFS